MAKYKVLTASHAHREGTSVNGNPYYIITWDDLSFSRTKVDGSVNYDLQNSENFGVPLAVYFTKAGYVEQITPLDKVKKSEPSGFRWIMYLHQPFGGMAFSIAAATSLEVAKTILYNYSREVGVYEDATAMLYPYSEEDWADAKEYEEIGCPFDYPSKRMSFGPRGGIKVENA